MTKRFIDIENQLNTGVRDGIITDSEKLHLLPVAHKNYVLFKKIMGALEAQKQSVSNVHQDQLVAESITAKCAADTYDRLKNDPVGLAELEQLNPLLYARCFDEYRNMIENPENKSFDWLQRNAPSALREIEDKNPSLYNKLLDQYENSL